MNTEILATSNILAAIVRNNQGRKYPPFYEMIEDSVTLYQEMVRHLERTLHGHEPDIEEEEELCWYSEDLPPDIEEALYPTNPPPDPKL